MASRLHGPIWSTTAATLIALVILAGVAAALAYLLLEVLDGAAEAHGGGWRLTGAAAGGLIFWTVGAGLFLRVLGPVAQLGKLERILAVQTSPFASAALDDERTESVIARLDRVERLLPTEKLLPALRELFDRNTFKEPIYECTSEDWSERLRVAILVDRLLNHHSGSLAGAANVEPRQGFEHLRSAVRRYRDRLTALFHNGPFSTSELDNLSVSRDAFERELSAVKRVKPARFQEVMQRGHEGIDAVRKINDAMVEISDAWGQLGEGSLFRDDKRTEMLAWPGRSGD